MSVKKVAVFQRKQPKGYSYDEIQYRLMVNDLQIRLEKGKLMHSITAGNEQTKNNTEWSDKLDLMLSYGQMAFLGYRAYKNISSFFKKFRNKG